MKAGPCAPLRLSSMLSSPATGIDPHLGDGRRAAGGDVSVICQRHPSRNRGATLASLPGAARTGAAALGQAAGPATVSRMAAATRSPADIALPPRFAQWFAARGWPPHAHQLAMLAAARAGRSALLIAPTGGGKTLAGFLPSLIELADGADRRPPHALHLAAEGAGRRHRAQPRDADRGDAARRPRRDPHRRHAAGQARAPARAAAADPADHAGIAGAADLPIPKAARMFGDLRCVIIDELHALAGTKRGDLLALGLARLARLAPAGAPRRPVGDGGGAGGARALAGLGPAMRRVERIVGRSGARPEIAILRAGGAHCPGPGTWACMRCRRSTTRSASAGTTLVFVNTRAQAELVFQALWRINDDNLPIALHHGSLAVEQRRKVEAAMAAGKLRAVVATSSLDLGIDWGDVDLVIQVGAPKGVIAPAAAHRPRQPPPRRAEPRPARAGQPLRGAGMPAAVEAIAERELDGDRRARAGSTCSPSTSSACACRGRSTPTTLYRRGAHAPRPTPRCRAQDFDDVLALRRDRRLRAAGLRPLQAAVPRPPTAAGTSSAPRVARQYRMNVGTIVEAPMLQVQAGAAGRKLGEVEEYFVQGARRPATPSCSPADCCASTACARPTCDVTRGDRRRARRCRPMPAAPAADHAALADRVRGMLADRARWRELPAEVHDWLRAAAAGARVLPEPRRAAGRDASRAAGGTSWSPTASRAATRTRRSACC